MSKQCEALKLAQAFIRWTQFGECRTEHHEGPIATAAQVDAAIREALAEPEPEPVAWSYWQSCLDDDGNQTAPWVPTLSQFKPQESIINKDIKPLYLAPPTRKPLTDEQLEACREEANRSYRRFKNSIRGQVVIPEDDWEYHFARAIERAHGIGGEK